MSLGLDQGGPGRSSRIRHPGLDNHAVGSIFEELVRRFNEENNEEAGECQGRTSPLLSHFEMRRSPISAMSRGSRATSRVDIAATPRECVRW